MAGQDSTIRRRALPPASNRRRCLRIVDSPDRAAIGRAFDPQRPLIIGRAGEAEGAIGDPLMSREHARIGSTKGIDLYFIEDLQTRNGTFLNGARVDGLLSVTAGDVLCLGATLIVVDEEPDPDSLPAARGVDGSPVKELVGVSFAAERLRQSIVTAASGPGSVLIMGPTGAGKEVAARAIHRLSGRSGAWVPVNCAAIPAEIAEAEFFGYRKGAFTGADRDRDGFFVQAEGGTLFLDEIGDLPMPLQAKLLRVLEEGEIQPLGGGSIRQIDVRVVAATHVDLAPSRFRRDLLARLGDWVLHLPPLIERCADILVLWDHFQKLDGNITAPLPRTPELSEALLLHEWPMNIRELRKLTRRLTAMAGPNRALDLDDLPEALQAPVRNRDPNAAPQPKPEKPKRGKQASPQSSAVSPAEADTQEVREPPSKEVLEAALKSAAGNMKRVADELGCHRTQLYRWARRYGLDPDSYR
jgi:DNA-binding NtrC family response regulator